MSEMLDFALRYAGAGYLVFPLKPASKVPCTEHGVVDATSDAKIIRRWWKRWPNANIGMALEGLVVVDIDPRNGADPDECAAKLPETCYARTGGGGLHYLYRTVNGSRYAKLEGAAGIDIKHGRNQYIVVEPSIHPSGEKYVWIDETEPWGMRPKDAPSWLAQSSSAGPRTKKNLEQRSFSAEADVIRSAARAIPNADLSYDEWIAIGLAIKGALGESGADVWREFSERSAKNNPEETERAWPTFKPDRIGAGTLIHLAQAAGWVNPKTKPVGANATATSGASERTVANATGEWKPKPVSAAELLRMDFPAVRWTIDDILPEGLFILAARPKIGKSWFALQVALGVASGAEVLNRRTAKGSALYLALEDNKPRLQSRLVKHRAGYLADQAALTRVDFEVQWRRADDGGIEDIHAWLDAHPDARLVVIDTLEKFRARRNERANAYGEDYAALQGIKAVCDTRRITVLVVHHVRKAASDDPIDAISGTLGLGGAADGALVFTRSRGSEQAELHLVGRDIPGEGAYAVRFDRATCKWEMEGKASEVAKTRERQEVVDLLRREGKAMQPNEIAIELGRNRVTVRRLLQRLIVEGKLHRDEKGRYTLLT